VWVATEIGERGADEEDVGRRLPGASVLEENIKTGAIQSGDWCRATEDLDFEVGEESSTKDV